ncbi:phosphoadenosine phosphosulfate reductase domain-containing protein [Picosynechococcus sp. PCC 11901]|uniref:phosphoadenosine phosphosulfate reductase domain-containing protein n=1 Tax=Picosynechococcus sp. PCC 11901 TaxID=2579791 RepID=UPI0030D785F4
MSQKVRHVLGLSGGKDSSALAVLLHKEIPDMEYFFCDTQRNFRKLTITLTGLRRG